MIGKLTGLGIRNGTPGGKALAEPAKIRLPSGPTIVDPFDRMVRFCQEEYAYYDGLPQSDPDRIAPLDVLATVAVNGFYSANAAVIRNVHRGLAKNCDPILSVIPCDADLAADDAALDVVEHLLHAAIQVRGVLVPVATKVLHRKRTALIPILDNVLLAHYLGTAPNRLPSATQDKSRAAGAASEALRLFRADLLAGKSSIDAVVTLLATAGFLLSPVRVLEVLLWTEVEERGYYR
jgi:hypothetical protein